MRITLTGTGTPELDPNRQHSTVLLETQNASLLFDAGRGVTTQLLKIGRQPQQISAVFITHHHYDHICDLGEFLMAAWHNGRQTQLPIFGPPGTREIVDSLLTRVFARDIMFSLKAAHAMPDIRRLVSVTEVSPGWSMESGTWSVCAGQVEHGHSLGLSFQEWPCLGYRVESEGKAVVISGDTVECQGIIDLAHGADLLVQCCHFAETGLSADEKKARITQIIATAGQAGRIARRAEVKKLVLTHITSKDGTTLNSITKEVRGEFSGEIIPGKDLLSIDI